MALIETNVPASNAVPTHPPAAKRLQMLLGVTDQILHDSELLDWGKMVLETALQMPRMNPEAA